MAIRIDDVDLDRDRALVQRFQAGDGRAFDELYGRYRNRLERFCQKRLGDPHAAEEVAQEAFTRALAALPAFGGERRFYPWVSVIASRLCVDYHRNLARSALARRVEDSSVPACEDAVVDAVDRELVTTALARLGPRHQDVLRLREVDGWSYRRIADHYQVPVGTIETLLFRARRALRREFDIIDGAGLAVIAFVGWLIRGLGRARDRMAPMATLGSGPSGLAIAATAAVTVVAMAVVPGGGPPPAGVGRNHVAAGHAQPVPAHTTADRTVSAAPGRGAAAPTVTVTATTLFGQTPGAAVAGDAVAGAAAAGASTAVPAIGLRPDVPFTLPTIPRFRPPPASVPVLPEPPVDVGGVLAGAGVPPAPNLGPPARDPLVAGLNSSLQPAAVVPALPLPTGDLKPPLGNITKAPTLR